MSDKKACHDNIMLPHEDDCCSSDSDNEAERMPAISASGPSTHVVSATKAASALLISASDKAGMAGVDRERINAILLRESGNSTFMQRQRKTDESSNRKIEEMKRRLDGKDNTSVNDWRRELNKSTIDPLLQRYRDRRRPLSTCVVVDMDGFFISCHILDHPHLANIPACVGGKSMISTSNYVARQYGVRAAMPGYLGSKLVQELSGGKETLTFVESDFDLYKKKSSEVRSVLEEYDPNLSMYSLDEAYMDIGPYLEVQLFDKTGSLSHEDIRKLVSSKPSSKENKVNLTQRKRLHEHLPIDTIHTAAKALLHSIREKVKTSTGLTCSAGLSSNFLLAKIASDINKPNGQHFVGSSEKEIIEFVNPLPIRKINGIGRVMEKMLRGVSNIETVKDLYDRRAELYFLFKPASANFLMRACIGFSEESERLESAEEENCDTEEALHRKGISHERTFPPTSSWSNLCTNLEKITLCLVRDLKDRHLRPKTITLKVKLDNFDILTRAITRDIALFQNCNLSQSCQGIVDIVVNLLKEVKREHEHGGAATKTKITQTAPKRSPFSVRLLGVRCSNFQHHEDTQQSMHRYGASRNQDCADKPPALHDNSNSPVKNPYLSPKSTKIRRDNIETKRLDELPSTAAQSELASAVNLKKRIQCPLCQVDFPNNEDGNSLLNAHIDECLNATTVKKLANEETACADERMKNKKRRLTDFFGS